MKTILSLIFSSLFLFFAEAKDPVTLSVGSEAPDFNLKGVDGKMHTLESFRKAPILVIIFTCNHCPTAQAYEDRIIAFQEKYKEQGVQVVAISPNADKAVRFDELGYTDLSDSYEEMVIRAKDKKYNFPYLYDGESQTTATAYGPTTTPHAFVFNKKRILKYVGRIDDEEHIGRATKFDLENAVKELLEKDEVSVPETKTFGCSIKWMDKADWKLKEVESWKSEEVKLEDLNIEGLKKLMTEKSEKYRLINFWATWCGPCVTEFSALTETDKMYRNRDFEFISISIDDAKSRNKVTEFLKKKYASNKNYLYGNLHKYELIEAVDKKWPGALPYTILLSPDGKIVYRQSGMIEARDLRKAIVEHIGRYYP